jgi:hypothetical protein
MAKRIVVWGTGFVGKMIIPEVLKHPEFELVGVGVSTFVGVTLGAAAGLAVTGAADSISVVTRLTLMQLETPDNMRGRVSAVNSIFIGASNQLGEFESGATAAMWGPVGSVVVGGAATVFVAMAWLLWFPDLAHRDHMVSGH